MAPVCEVPRKVWRVRSGTPFEYSTFNLWATRWRQMWRHSFQMLKIWKHWLLNSVANLKAALHIEALYRATMVHTQFRCSKGADIKFCLVNSTTVLKVISVRAFSSLLLSFPALLHCDLRLHRQWGLHQPGQRRGGVLHLQPQPKRLQLWGVYGLHGISLLCGLPGSGHLFPSDQQRQRPQESCAGWYWVVR